MNNKYSIWGHDIPEKFINKEDIVYLDKFKLHPIISIDQLWHEMDRVWDFYNLNNKKSLKSQNIAGFYSHPVWILNGLFSSVDEFSVLHRKAIADFISKIEYKNSVCDFGGGFGELAIKIAETVPNNVMINIVEPFPSNLGSFRVSKFSNIVLTSQLSSNYDIIIAQDVLEHIENPIQVSIELINALKYDGYIIFANCFHPYIKAHLPNNFYLSEAFKWVISSAGLKFVSNLPNAPHIQVYQKKGKVYRFEIFCKSKISKMKWNLKKLNYLFK